MNKLKTYDYAFQEDTTIAIGYIKRKVVEGVETLVPETTAGPSAGTVRKLSFDCNVDYAVPITADETGEGYIGVSGNCKLSFNPKYNIGTVADPEYIGVLKADCFCGKGTNTEIADCVEIGEVCQNLNYKVPFTCNCEVLTACSQNLLYNPNTGLLCSNCMCIANNLEVMCDVCADEYKSRTSGVGITVDTTAEDDTLNHNGDVIYKGCNGELATSSCKDFKYNPSTGTLTVDHVCSCDVQNEISDSKLCNTGTSSICYCSSAKAQDNAAVVMHAYRCTIGSNNPLESYATLDYDGFYLTCVPFCQQEGSSSNYTRAQIGGYCNNFASENGMGGRVYSNMASTSLAIGEGLVCCMSGYLCSSLSRTECINQATRVPYRCLSAICNEDVVYGYVGCTHICQDDYQVELLARCVNNNGLHWSCLIVKCDAIAGYTCDDSQGIKGCFELDVVDGRFKLCNSATGGSCANVLTECDVGASCMLNNKDSSATCLMFEGGNELNTYGTSPLWINYRGGTNAIYIGNGTGCVAGCLRAGQYDSALNNGGSWGGADAVFRHDTSLPLGDIWYPMLSQCVCNGSYQFQLGWYGCQPDSWAIRETKNGTEWWFKGTDGSFDTEVLCTRTICFY